MECVKICRLFPVIFVQSLSQVITKRGRCKTGTYGIEAGRRQRVRIESPRDYDREIENA